MGLIRFVLWTGCAMALGAWMVTSRYNGKTPWEHAQEAWSHQVSAPRVEELKSRFHETLEDARDALAEDAKTKPRERHSLQDREQLNKLIAAKAKK